MLGKRRLIIGTAHRLLEQVTISGTKPPPPPPRGRGEVRTWGRKTEFMPELTYTQAIVEAFREEMRRDSKVFHLCGGLGPLGALIPEFGEQRVRVCPISESAYVGAAVGAAGAGFRPVVSPRHDDLRLHSHGPDRQSDGQDSLHVRGSDTLPHRLPRLHRRGPGRSSPALPEPPPALHQHRRPQGPHAFQPLRRQGLDEKRHPRQQPGRGAGRPDAGRRELEPRDSRRRVPHPHRHRRYQA